MMSAVRVGQLNNLIGMRVCMLCVWHQLTNMSNYCSYCMALSRLVVWAVPVHCMICCVCTVWFTRGLSRLVWAVPVHYLICCVCTVWFTRGLSRLVWAVPVHCLICYPLISRPSHLDAVHIIRSQFFASLSISTTLCQYVVLCPTLQ